MTRLGERSREALGEVGRKYLQAVAHDTAVIHARPAEGIIDVASNQDFDLVVLATRGLSGVAHALFGSVAERVVLLSKVPVLTVRGSA
jgi:nucleotide-binding universal stress UspA family protein